jgi:hypothetical protein
MERINSLLNAANDISYSSFQDNIYEEEVQLPRASKSIKPKKVSMVFEVLPLPHLSLFLTKKLLLEEKSSYINIQQEILSFKKRKIQKMLTSDVYLSFPKMLVDITNSFDKNSLVSFHKQRTTENFEFLQIFQNNPFEHRLLHHDNNNEDQLQLEKKNEKNETECLKMHVIGQNNAINTMCNSWIIFPDKIWKVRGAQITMLNNKNIEVKCLYNTVTTLIFDLKKNDFFSSTASCDCGLLKKNKNIEVDGVVTLFFNDEKLLKKIEIVCCVHVEDEK